MGEFEGEVADYYARFRPGYPDEFVGALVAALGLDADDTVLDVGCGTGQLTLPLAARVRAAVGVDPEPDMLARARAEAADRQVGNVNWVLGADTDLPALATLRPAGFGAMAAATAIHLMDHTLLFRVARSLLRPGGGVAVVAHGTPWWLQDTDWSHTVRGCLERWYGTSTSGDHCGTDDSSRDRYREALAAAGYVVMPEEVAVSYSHELTVDRLLGLLYSAIPAPALPARGAERGRFATMVREALAPRTTFPEEVRVTALVAHLPG